MEQHGLKYIHKFTGEEYFPDKEFPFFVQRYVHDWSSLPILPMHSHEFIEIVFVVKGSVTHYFQSEQYGELKYKIYPGDIFIINPGELHMYEIEKTEKVELVNLLFLPQLINWNVLASTDHAHMMDLFYVQPFSGKEVRFHSLLKLDEASREEIYALVVKLEDEFAKQLPGYHSLIGLKLMELMIYLSRQYGRNTGQPSRDATPKQLVSDAALKKVISYMERNFSQDIALKDLTDIAMCSPRHLGRMFKKEVGMSPIHFLHYVRVEHSKKHLLSTSKKIVTIGQEVGFPDATFFNKVFKKLENCTPTQYRQLYAGKTAQGD